MVTKGQPMFVIDKVSYEAALENAIANVDVAKAAVAAAELTAEAKEQLHGQGIISDFELQMARTTLDKERGQLALAKANEANARLLQATDRFEEITAIIALYKALGGR